MRRLEQTLQISVVDYLMYCVVGPKLVHSVPNEGKRGRVSAANLKRMGLYPGAADLILIYDGRAHYIECKAGDGKQTEVQRLFQAEALASGAGYAVVRSIEDVQSLMNIWDIPTRETK